MATEASMNTSRIDIELQGLVSEVGASGQSLANEEKDLLSGTLEACLKVLLQQKSTAEDRIVRLQGELTLAKERMKKLEHAVKGRGSKAKQLAKKLSETEKERLSLLDELKSCHHQLKEELEKKQKLQNLYTESLKAKNSRIQALEQENRVLRQAGRTSSEFTGDSPEIYPGQPFGESPGLRVPDENASHSREQSENSRFEQSQENFNWDPYFGGIMVSQDDVDGMVDNYDLLQFSYTEALKAKNERIQQLEEEYELLKNQKKISMSQMSILSSDLSLDSYQYESLSMFGSQELASSSAPAHVLRQGFNQMPQKHRSFSLSDGVPRRLSVPEQLRKPRPNIRQMQMESLDSVSPCSTPSYSGSVTPTSTSGSYSGVLGSGKLLTKKLQDVQENESQNSAAVDVPQTSVSWDPTTIRYKRGTVAEREAINVSGHTRRPVSQKTTISSLESEAKQPRIGYMTKRQKERKLREKSGSYEAGSSSVPAILSEDISSELHSSTSTHVSIEENNMNMTEQEEAESKQVRKESTEISAGLSPLPKNHVSAFTNAEALTSIPQWKRELIQKKKMSVSSSRGQSTSLERSFVQPEWVKKVQKRNESSSSSSKVRSGPRKTSFEAEEPAAFMLEFQTKKKNTMLTQ